MKKENKGRVKRYQRKRYGSKAFNSDGTLKMSYLRKSKEHLKNSDNTSLKRAVQEAINFKSGGGEL